MALTCREGFADRVLAIEVRDGIAGFKDEMRVQTSMLIRITNDNDRHARRMDHIVEGSMRGSRNWRMRVMADAILTKLALATLIVLVDRWRPGGLGRSPARAGHHHRGPAPSRRNFALDVGATAYPMEAAAAIERHVAGGMGGAQ
jgi:hypothetical protein